ncbi:thioredoxin-dependent thiol peroxidase [uncultured Veillonella sp.]|uniref:thioredoxin-dependent thiol peroxidase n=1 Tax=uncultured Veillonella sp. TaxID=159268 RepID=UPI0026113AB2|nr:thioredoxin-dependent thiol peroxidase [uncultured Veillonella sp.]
MTELTVGMKAPGFSALSDANEMVSLDNFLGKKVILYFYPKDNTPGCSVEAQQFNAAYDALYKAGYVVLGVSRDTVKRHVNFKAKYDLKFLLLADTDEAICNAYGVMKEKKLYGKVSIGIERSTFVIDETGQITHIYRGVKAKEHVGALLVDLGVAE